MPNFRYGGSINSGNRAREYAGFESDITLKELFNTNDTNFFLAVLNTDITLGQNNDDNNAPVGLEININKKQLNFSEIIYGEELPSDGIIYPKGNNCIYKVTPNFDNIDENFSMAMINQNASLYQASSSEYYATDLDTGNTTQKSIGAIVFGKMYEMDIAADLNIKQTIETVNKL